MGWLFHVAQNLAIKLDMRTAGPDLVANQPRLASGGMNELELEELTRNSS